MPQKNGPEGPLSWYVVRSGGDKLPCHRHFYRVAIRVEVIQAGLRHISRRALRDEDLLRHQRQARHLRRGCIAEIDDLYGQLLTDPPRPARGLLKRVDVPARLEKHDRRKLQKIQARLDQFGVGQQHIDAPVELIGNPVFAP